MIDASALMRILTRGWGYYEMSAKTSWELLVILKSSLSKACNNFILLDSCESLKETKSILEQIDLVDVTRFF